MNELSSSLNGPVTENSMKTKAKKKWSYKVKTNSTHPPEKLFTKDAKTIARGMLSKKVSPRGIGSGIRMIQFFINRAGKNLPRGQRAELEKAKKIMREKLDRR
jgi:tRNA(adenine34) deaminase